MFSAGTGVLSKNIDVAEMEGSSLLAFLSVKLCVTLVLKIQHATEMYAKVTVYAYCFPGVLK